MPDAGHTRDVVGFIPGERQVIGEALRANAVVALDVVIAELAARAEIPQQVAVAHQLRQVLVAGDEGGAHAGLAHRARERANDVVGLIFGVDELGQTQMPAQLAAAAELLRQILGRALAVGLVGREQAPPVRFLRALVEGDRHVSRTHPLDQVAEKAREAEHGMRRVAVPVAHVGQHRVVGAENVDRGVDEEDHAAELSRCNRC